MINSMSKADHSLSRKTPGDLWYSDQELLAPYLYLEKDGYLVYVMGVNDQTKNWTEQVREVHKMHLKKAGYDGFSNRIDNEYHLVGTYFFVIKDNEIVLTSRINDRTKSSRFPFEMGQRPNGEHYVFQDKIPAVDINTYSVMLRHYRRAMPLLLAAFGKYIDDLGAKRAFCLVDRENKVTQRMYHDDFHFLYSTTFEEPIVFPSFLNGLNQQPVEWKMMEWNEQTIKYYSELHRMITIETK
ncbi:MAG: hypothetical protein F6K50_23175 [Moorea sp. SIO3I7]|uniref:hypothetical protein n=1 Tax=unclassified Moorena TaxID=2683338 RepID=UPI0013C591C7|nr:MULTISPECIES: hypothetical protein [unclassified Moorena]NEN98311.1 hypothetical protein [Moorena sp. SIO3I7]NEO19015.1 hypothetical protein [Moorena sp. SIO4A5]NEP25114.1 hypothetical protein [Moorena sp. SIO3I6]NEQ56357.1 hypothetical protein [Moorena sp. SIO4A1]